MDITLEICLSNMDPDSGNRHVFDIYLCGLNAQKLQ